MIASTYLKLCKAYRATAHETKLYPVSDVICLHVNEAALAEYCPDLLSKCGNRDLTIRQWIIDNFAVLSKEQAFFQEPFNALAFSTRSGPSIVGHRQPGMGRSCTVEVGEPVRRLWDIKGCGVDQGQIPLDSAHENGLLGLLPAIREYIYAEALRLLFSDGEGLGFRPARIFALLAFTRVCTLTGKMFPCALLVREPLIRSIENKSPHAISADWNLTVEIELTLRKYGLTSVVSTPLSLKHGQIFDLRSASKITHSEHNSQDINSFTDQFLDSLNLPREFRVQVANIQYAQSSLLDPVLVDFEHYKVAPDFPECAIVFPACDRPFGLGGYILRDQIPRPRSLPSAVAALKNLFTLVQPAEHYNNYFWCDLMSSKCQIYRIWHEVLDAISAEHGDMGAAKSKLCRVMEGAIDLVRS